MKLKWIVIGNERRKDNLNLVIFHCVHLRIIFFTFIFNLIPLWKVLYSLRKYYLPFSSSFFFRIYFIFYLCLHIYSPCYVMFLMLYFLFILKNKVKLRTFPTLWMFLAWKGLSKTFLLFFFLLNPKSVVIQVSLICLLNLFVRFHLFNMPQILIYFMFIDFLSSFSLTKIFLSFFYIIFTWPRLDLEKSFKISFLAFQKLVHLSPKSIIIHFFQGILILL